MRLLALWCLAGLVAAAPRDRESDKRALENNDVLLGFRSMRQVELTLVKATKPNPRLVATIENAGRQLGSGAYLAKTFRGWTYEERTMDCAVFAKADVWAKVLKAYVPQSWNDHGVCKPLWSMLPNNKKNRSDFLGVVNSGGTQDNTITFSDIKDPQEPDQQQMFIPSALLEQYEFPVVCADNLPDSESVADSEVVAALAPLMISWTDCLNWPGSKMPEPAPQ